MTQLIRPSATCSQQYKPACGQLRAVLDIFTWSVSHTKKIVNVSPFLISKFYQIRKKDVMHVHYIQFKIHEVSFGSLEFLQSNVQCCRVGVERNSVAKKRTFTLNCVIPCWIFIPTQYKLSFLYLCGVFTQQYFIVMMI